MKSLFLRLFISNNFVDFINVKHSLIYYIYFVWEYYFDFVGIAEYTILFIGLDEVGIAVWIFLFSFGW